MTVAYPTITRRLKQKLRLGAQSNLYWSCRDERNFGDWVGPYLFEALSGREAIFCKPKGLVRGHVTFTVGSVLHWIQLGWGTVS